MAKDKPITFAEHKEQTAKDCEELSKILLDLASKVREGNLEVFEQFWFTGGTEEGDAKIAAVREILMLRYQYRRECVVEEPSAVPVV